MGEFTGSFGYISKMKLGHWHIEDMPSAVLAQPLKNRDVFILCIWKRFETRMRRAISEVKSYGGLTYGWEKLYPHSSLSVFSHVQVNNGCHDTKLAWYCQYVARAIATRQLTVAWIVKVLFMWTAVKSLNLINIQDILSGVKWQAELTWPLHPELWRHP